MKTESYHSGETPIRGDVIAHHRRGDPVGVLATTLEEQQNWIVTSICGDMVRCKCQAASLWRQAHYTNQMRLIHRKV